MFKYFLYFFSSFFFYSAIALPIAILPEDIDVSVGTEVVIDGSNSMGEDLSYRWNFDVFPVLSNTRIDDPTASSIRFTPDVPGLYLIKLIVRNSTANSPPTYMRVRATEINALPSFSFTPHIKSNGFPKLVRFRLRDISDSDGDVSFVEIDYGDGKQSTFYIEEIRSGFSGSHRIEYYYKRSGVYNAKIALIDDKGGRTERSVSVDLSSDNHVPVLKYNTNSTSGVAPFTLRVDASQSFDPDNNTPLRFNWYWDDGTPDTYTENTVSTHTYTTPGIYQVEAFARDSTGSEVYNYFSVYVDDPNNLGTYSAPSGGSYPVLDLTASSSIVGQAPLTVNFDASHSFDLEGDDFQVFWDFDGFIFKKLDKGLTTTRTYNYPGTYHVKVTVQDSHGNEYNNWFDVRVYDEDLDWSPQFVIAQNEDYEFDIFIPNNIYGPAIQYAFWSFGDDSYDSGGYNTHTYRQNGIYPVTLTVIDVLGNRKSATRMLTVRGEEYEIDGNIGPFYQTARVGASVSLTTSQISSNVPGPLEFFWNLLNGFKETANITHSYSKKGIYKHRLYITNSYGTSEDFTSIFTNVHSGNPPTANYRLSTYIGPAPLTVNFDGSQSHSSSGVSEYYWMLGNSDELNNSSDQSQFSYTYETPGKRYVDFIVKDNNGNFDIGFPLVHVLDPAEIPANNQNPVVSIDSNNIVINDLDVRLNDINMSDADGEILFTEWSWGDGDIEVFRRPEKSPRHTYQDYGTYTLTVRVFDNFGAIATATHNITLMETSLRSTPGASIQ